MKKILLFLLLLSVGHLLVGQISPCGHQHLLDSRSPQIQQSTDQAYENALRQIHKSNSRSRQLLTVPVVFHIIHHANDPAQNVSDEAVLSQLAVLNEDFQRRNADAGEARSIFRGVAGNPDIQFVLADTDPDGNPTTGITRTQTSVPTFLPINVTNEDLLNAADSCNIDLRDPEQLLDSIFCFNFEALNLAAERLSKQDTTQGEDMKFTDKGGMDAWDTERYINIWVCNLKMRLQGAETAILLGFATPPMEAPNWEVIEFPENYKALDGLVIHYEAFGRNPLVEDYPGGRVGTHEMGHYFGLRHTFGDGNCSNDDGLSDTPSTNQFFPPESFEELNDRSCERAKKRDTCLEDDLPDMVENYMSYSPQSCQNLFTDQQSVLMRSMLEGPRSGLILDNITSTFSAALDQAVTLYPNPTSGFLQVEMEGFNKEDFSITLENVIGQQFLTQAATTPLHIGHLEKGLYWVRLSSEELEVVKKVILK